MNFSNDGKLEEILGIIADGYYELDMSGTFIFVNDALCKIFGYHKNSLLGSNINDFADQATNIKGINAFREVLNTRIPKNDTDWEIVGGDGKKRYVEASISLIFDGDDKDRVIGYRGILRDITGRKLAEEDQRKSEERFRFLIEKSPLGIALMDKDNNYKYLNPKFMEMFGYRAEEIITGRDWLRKAYPDKDYRNLVIANWKNNIMEFGIGEARIQPRDVQCKDGSKKTIKFTSVNMERGDLIIFCEDITEQKRLESQLVQAQKVESLGTLAGGIAHNFNNLLMGIQGNSSLMLLDMEESHPYYIRLKNIEKLVQSGAKLTYQLLGYARAGNYEIRPISLNQVIMETADTFAMAKKEIRIHFELDEDGCGIIADQSQIEQVLLNLFVNAADAMPTGGDLFVSTSFVNSEVINDKVYVPKPGEYVLMSVRDTGIGIEQSIINRIFDPFFTTKGLGRGTGLGLASVYGIVKAHGGYIDVESQKGYGTTFRILLPRSKKGSAYNKSEPAVMVKGSGTILVADDEIMVLDIAIQYLEMLGYKVLSARGGVEAVNTYKEKKDEIDLVILDLIMPDMGGGEVYNLIKAANPEAKVILSSGYSIEGQASEILARGCNGFIQKPFDMETVSREIKRVLNSGSSPN
jgi:two-component system, cell cycle sensor histidine kinase and response regulator CckA